MSGPPGIGIKRDDLIEKVRLYIGDMPEENRITPGYEVSDDKIRLAIDLALDEYNNSPPFEAQTLETFPSLNIILLGSVLHTLSMAGIVQSRNFLNFNDGRFSSAFGDKGAAYQSWIANIIANYQAQVNALKTSLNMERNFGVIGSPYGNTMFWD